LQPKLIFTMLKIALQIEHKNLSLM